MLDSILTAEQKKQISDTRIPCKIAIEVLNITGQWHLNPRIRFTNREVEIEVKLISDETGETFISERHSLMIGDAIEFTKLFCGLKITDIGVK